MACGAPAASVHGDVYAGRVVDCEEAFERRDFLIADMDSNAPWVALAKEVNGRRAAGGAGAAEARVKAALGDAGANAQFGSVTAPGGAGLGSEATGGAVGAATWRDADDGELELRVRLPEGPLRERGAAKLLNVSLKRGGKELLVTAKGVEVPLQIVAAEIRAAKDETVVHLEALYEPDQRREFEPLDALRPAEWVGVPRLHLALPHVCQVHLIGRVSREGRRAP